MRKINLFGASGHAKVIIDIIERNGFQVGYIFDDNTEVENFMGRKVYSVYSLELLNANPIIISIGDNKVRKAIHDKFQLNLAPPLIHPSAIVSPSASIGNGTVIMPNAVINAAVSIGKNCIINTAAVVEHDGILHDYTHISPNASLAGGVEIKEGTHVGINATIIQSICVGSWSTIGAGAVVVKNLPNNCTAVGIPAKPIKFHN
jgi:sugar O-acyltransferase (sialic acid O-acetyltransferase NeuD family)